MHSCLPVASILTVVVMQDNPTLALACALIEKRSITPEDAGCQPLLIARLQAVGFEVEIFDHHETSNFLAIRKGCETGLSLCFAGHTDVVPTGPLEKWRSDPFVPVVRDGKLYGRGVADMKSGIAAFVVAVENFVVAHPEHRGTIALLITSDEEGPALHGTRYVVQRLRERGQRFDYCIVGEPSSTRVLGDMIKNGRRGTLSARLVVKGVQGHIAYPHLAKNPIHAALPALAELAATEWDRGNAYFPATSFQISNMHSGTGAYNVIPGTAEVYFNFRFSTEHTQQSLTASVENILHKHALEFDIFWTLGGNPFLTKEGALVNAMRTAGEEITGTTAEISTTGGTSDGRFMAEICDQVAEFGLVNESIHKLDEHALVADLARLSDIYYRTLALLLA
jgi:succinyl-diaminopimelate desuccinylase